MHSQPTRDDLESFVDRARAVLEDAPSSPLETRTWLVDPFLATLGWDVHADGVTTDVRLGGANVAYVCSVDSIPAVFVAVESARDSLSRGRATELAGLVAETGVDGAIYANGREFAFLVGGEPLAADASGERVESTACRLAALPEREGLLGAFSAATARERFERRSRPLVARQLAVDRRSIVDAIADELVEAAGPAYRNEFESAADRFLDELRDAFLPNRREHGGGETGSNSAASANNPGTLDAGSDADTSEPATDAGGSNGTDDVDTRPESASEARDGRRPVDDGAAGDDGAASDDRATIDDEPASDDEDGEYVVRFFEGSRSIGAIGSSTSAETLVQAAEYLFERGLSGVELPWAAEDGRVVLDERPVRDDGTPMSAPRELSNGYYLETAGDVRERARRVEALAGRAGLRAMLTGDWEDPD